MTNHTGARYAHSWASARTHASQVEADHAARIAAGQASLRAAAGMVAFLHEGRTPDAADLGIGIPGIPQQGGHPAVERQPAPEPVLPVQRSGYADDAAPELLDESLSAGPAPARGSATEPRTTPPAGFGLVAAGRALMGRRKRSTR